MNRARIGTVALTLALIAPACGGASAPPAPVGTNPPTPTIPPLVTTAAPPPPPTSAAPATTSPPATTKAPPPPTTSPPVTEPPSEAQLALGAALESSAATLSGRAEGVFEISAIDGMPEGTVITLRFSQAFDTAAGTSAFVMDMSELAAAVPPDELPPEMAELFGEMEMRQIGDTAYLRFPFFTALVGVETDWISFPQDPQAVAQAVSPVAPVNPNEFLETFSAVGAEVTEQGREVIRGVETTRYLVTFSMEELMRVADPEELADLEAMGPLPFDALPMDIWISDDGLVHRFVFAFDAASAGPSATEDFGRMVMRFDMYDHNRPVDIEPPPALDVTDGSELGFVFDT